MKMIIIDTPREGYCPRDVSETLTVGELIELLSEYEPDSKVVTCHDDGYTYGGINWARIREVEPENED